LRATQILFSIAYLDETLGLLVEDADRARFESWDQVRATAGLTVAVPNLPYYVDKLHQLVPEAGVVKVSNVGAVVEQVGGKADAMLLPAERGSAWTLIYPRFTVIVPGPAPIKMPLGYPIARRDETFADFVNTWIALKQKDGTIRELYDYWILGRTAEQKGRRWSVIKDVLHWER
jgi:ABC-type amino acid transport substrate-binding protein